MHINGRRAHLGERPVTGGSCREPAVLAPRQSPDPGLEVTWYPHKDAVSLLVPRDGMHEDYSCAHIRGAIVLVELE